MTSDPDAVASPKVISAPALLLESGETGPGAVVLADGIIEAVLDHVPQPGPDHLALENGILSPGMVDLQVNGCFGVDFARATSAEWVSARRSLQQTGVTAFLPTVITAPLDELVVQVAAIALQTSIDAPDQGAQVLGAHVEGPFLSPRYAGAHNPEFMVDPTEPRIDQLLSALDEIPVGVVTLAPERTGALSAIRQLSAHGVVISIGHTAAASEQVRAAADAGATMVTHLFNAQTGLHHREAGVVGTALADPRYTVGIIADLHHVAAPVLQLTFAAAGERVILVTDSVSATGLDPGTHTLGGEPTVVDVEGGPPRRRDGALAGSTLTLDQAVRNVVELGIPRGDALLAATAKPANAIRQQQLGRLTPGAVADLVWWSDALTVRRTWRAGTSRR